MLLRSTKYYYSIIFNNIDIIFIIRVDKNNKKIDIIEGGGEEGGNWNRGYYGMYIW
jgi:hypothetical protein